MHRQVLLADIASTTTAVATPLRQRGIRQHRVLVLGVCVWRERLGTAQLRIELDDGTDVALVQVRGEAVTAELVEVNPGVMVKVLGEVREAPVFASGRSWRRWIDASSVSVADDPNAESLHMLEALHAYRAVYIRDATAANHVVVEATSSIPLLEFPGKNEPSAQTGVKRKADPTESPARPKPTVMARTTQGVTGVLNPPAGPVAPAEYQFHVAGMDLKLIEDGTKTLEIRLNNPPYSIIRTNDRIKFNGRVMGTVAAVRKYAQLRSALEMETLAQLLPQQGGAPATLNGALRHFRQFISEAEESNHGVAVFEIRVHTVVATQRTPEEWSQLVYEHVKKAGGRGATLHDLQFSFPSLRVDQIEEILTDLQMDAVVYVVQGRYCLV